MGTRVYAVRTGDKYGQDVEDYINSKIPDVHWIKEETIGKHQWNKLVPMSLDIDEPVCVIDIDMSFINDYMDIINYPIEPGEFVAMQSWWNEEESPDYKLQGGFQKYYPKDCRYIYDKFVSNSEYWMEYYIKNGTTHGPVNGEQYFVEDSVKEKLKLKFLPANWCTKWRCFATTEEWLMHANIQYPGEWLFEDGEWNPDVKIIHYQMATLPHVKVREVRGW